MRTINRLFVFVLLCFSLLVISCEPSGDSVADIADREAKMELITGVLTMWNTMNPAMMQDLYQPDFSRYTPDSQQKSYDELEANMDLTDKTFSNFKVSLKEAVIEGNKAVVYFNMGGTNTGPMGEVPPTGESYSIEGMSFLTFSGGKIASERLVWDQLDFMTQLGFSLLPPAPPNETEEAVSED